MLYVSRVKDRIVGYEENGLSASNNRCGVVVHAGGVAFESLQRLCFWLVKYDIVLLWRSIPKLHNDRVSLRLVWWWSALVKMWHFNASASSNRFETISNRDSECSQHFFGPFE